MPLYLIEAPKQEDVLTLAEAKRHLRIDFNDHDDLIDDYIETAIQNVDGRDGWLGRAIGEQTWELRLLAFDNEIKIPLPPLIEVQSVKYFDASDVEQTLPADSYEVAGAGGFGKARVVLKGGRCWPPTANRAENVVIRFRAGYVTAGDNPVPNVPPAIKQAIRIMVADSYENRGGNFVSSSSVEGIGSKTYRQSSISGAVERILLPLRVW